MHFVTWLIMVLCCDLVICLGLVKMIGDLAQESAHQSPEFLETPSKSASAEELGAMATASHASRPREWSDAQ